MRDWAAPPGVDPVSEEEIALPGRPQGGGKVPRYRRAVWSGEALEGLAKGLSAEGSAALARIGTELLTETWCGTAEAFLDPRSELRQELDPPLAANCGLSPAALAAALEAMLAGYVGAPARELIERGRRVQDRGAATGRGLVTVILAGNIPGLVVQALLPALAAGRPLLVKSPSAEPLFAAVFVSELTRRLDALAPAVAAVTWAGGDATLEAPILDVTATLVAYGHAETLRELERRYGGAMIGLGPKLSVGIVSRDANPLLSGRALARDVALFEQRGCLSVQTVFLDGPIAPVAAGLAAGLEELAEAWPPPDLEAGLAGEIQQLRRLADLSPVRIPVLPIRSGTVLIAEPAAAGQPPPLEPVPGGRTVRLQPVDSLEQALESLGALRGRVQGAALAGEGAWRLAPRLEALGISRLAEAGRLQRPDALWANGDRHLLEELLESPAQS